MLAATIALGRPQGHHGPVRRRPLAELVYEDGWESSAPWAQRSCRHPLHERGSRSAPSMKSRMSGMAGRVLTEEGVATLVGPQHRARHARGDGLAVHHRGDAVEAAARHQRRAADGPQPVEHVVAAAGVELRGLTPERLLGLHRRVPRRHHLGQTPIGRVVGQPLRGEPGVQHAGRPLRPAPRGAGRPARAAGRTPGRDRRARCRPGPAARSVRARSRPAPGRPSPRSSARTPHTCPSRPRRAGRQRRPRSRAIVYGSGGCSVRPSPRWSWATTSNRARNGSMISAVVASVAPEPFRNSSRRPSPLRS